MNGIGPFEVTTQLPEYRNCDVVAQVSVNRTPVLVVEPVARFTVPIRAVDLPSLEAAKGDVLVTAVAAEIVTAPVLARALPFSVPPPRVTLVTARMFPFTVEVATDVNVLPAIK